MKTWSLVFLFFVYHSAVSFAINEPQDRLKSYQLSFEKVSDYFNRSQFWVEQFDKQLSLRSQLLVKANTNTNANTNSNTNTNTNSSVEVNSRGFGSRSFLESSSEYKILRALKQRQDQNLDQLVELHQFLIENNEDKSFVEKIKSLESLWRKRNPLVFEKIQERLDKMSSDFKVNLFTDKVKDELPKSLTNKEIAALQKIAALEGKNIEKLNNKNEILDLEKSTLEFFVELEMDFDSTTLDGKVNKKCIKPSLGTEGNLTGNELPKNNWVLTFDDGPSSKYTEDLLQHLRNNSIRASFFMLTKMLLLNPKIARDVDSDGHIIGHHSWSHADLSKVGEKSLDHEIVESMEVHQSVLDKKPKFFRCPYGAGYKEPLIRQRIVNEGMVHVLWNVDTLDWQDKNPDTIVSRTLNQMNFRERGIILFHDVHPQSLVATKALVEYLQANGNINWLDIQEAMNLVNKNRNCIEKNIE